MVLKMQDSKEVITRNDLNRHRDIICKGLAARSMMIIPSPNEKTGQITFPPGIKRQMKRIREAEEFMGCP